MTRDGIKKLAAMQKQSLWSIVEKLGSMAIVGLAVLTGGAGFLAGSLYSKATAPRKSDMANVTKQYQVQRLKSDIQKQRALLARQSRIYDDKEQPKKSVYGIV